MTRGQTADVFGWGSGPGAAANRTQTLTASEVAAMRQQGMTPDMARQWRDFYANEFSRNANNLTAKHRMELMDKVLGFCP